MFVSGEKDEVDPITMLLYQIHSKLSFREVTTLTAIASIPAKKRHAIEDGLDLFTWLTDEDRIRRDYLEMLLASIRRPDLLELVQRFYRTEWKYSAYAYTMETVYKTGEVPVVPRSAFRTVETTEKHMFDVYIHYAEADEEFAQRLGQMLEREGVTLLSGDFSEVWAVEPMRCRYCVPVISMSYLQVELPVQLQILLDQEINPSASLKHIIPVLRGVTPAHVQDTCAALHDVAQFSYIAGLGEYVKQMCHIVNKGLKASVNDKYTAAVTLHCSSKLQSGQNQTFAVSLSERDSFIVGRSETSVLFRGDKGIKGLREGNKAGHCVIGTSVGVNGRVGVAVRGTGHPLTFITVIAPIYLPHGVSTLLIGKEWISIASKRNASQCQAKLKIIYTEEDYVTIKVVNPAVREEVTVTQALVIGSGEGSNLKITVPGLDIGKQHCKLARTPEGWLLKPISPANHTFLQLPREEECEPVTVPYGGEILVGTSTTIRVEVTEDTGEDEGIGLSETCSRMSAKTLPSIK